MFRLPQKHHVAGSLPAFLLSASLLAAGGLVIGCGSDSSTPTPSAPAKADASADMNPEPIFDSDFESGNTDEWTETQKDDPGGDDSTDSQ